MSIVGFVVGFFLVSWMMRSKGFWGLVKWLVILFCLLFIGSLSLAILPTFFPEALSWMNEPVNF